MVHDGMMHGQDQLVINDGRAKQARPQAHLLGFIAAEVLFQAARWALGAMDFIDGHLDQSTMAVDNSTAQNRGARNDILQGTAETVDV